MAQRDDRHQQGGYRDHNDNARHQSAPYGDHPRPYGGAHPGERNDHRDRGRPERSDLRHNDPAQASYGRFGAPDVHHQPSGGYSNYGRQERSHDDSYGYGGYGSQGFNPGRSDDRGQDRGQHVGGRDRDGRYGGDFEQDRGRFQGGSGGYASNTGVYASSQPYGGPADQLGYGSSQGDRQQRSHYDPDYQQWRDEQMRNLDNDYHAWRGERYKKFSDEFGAWRSSRPAGDDKRSDTGSSSSAAPTSIGAGSGGSNTGTSGTK